MLESIRRIAVLPEIPTQALLSVGTIVTFGWLLMQDQIHPLMVYCLQLYLSF